MIGRIAPFYHRKNMKVALQRIGNSQGIILPKALLAQVGLTEGEAEMTIERDAIVLRKPKKSARAGWAEESARVAAAEGDAPVWPDLPTEEDRDIEW